MKKNKQEKAETLKEKVGEVQEKSVGGFGDEKFVAGNGVIEETRTERKGKPLLPSMEETVLVIPELRDAIKENKLVLVPNFQSAQKALSVSNKNIEEIALKYKEQLLLDEDRGVRTYDDGEVHVEIVEKDTLSFSVVKDTSE